MYCRNCATQLDDQAVACTQCGLPPRAAIKFCWKCGRETVPGAVACPGCGVSLMVPGSQSNRVAAGVCGILLGSLGVHKFILGYTTEGLIMLLATVLTCGFAAMATAVIGLIEGIIYLTKSDLEFHQTYVVNKRGWF